jgi:hypothetical protein
MEFQSESTLTHFIRSVFLLAALVSVPAAAVCWNMIPKDIFERGEYEQTTPLQTDTNDFASHKGHPAENNDSAEDQTVGSGSVFGESGVLNGNESAVIPPLSLPAEPQNTFSGGNLPNPPVLPVSSGTVNFPIKMMGGVDDSTSEQPISTSFGKEPVIIQAAATAEVAGMTPKYADQCLSESSVSAVLPNRSFLALESQLKQLGAKYYRLEKWGSRGELFRFSCCVTPSEQYRYQRYFQAIDSDELRVMENVIEEIKRWKLK